MSTTVKVRLSSVWSGALATALMTAVAAPASAAAAANSAAASDKLPELEEITVTADRRKSFSADLVEAGSFRSARQLDTPLTIAVIPQEVLQSQQAIDLIDAMRNTAGVTSSGVGATIYNNISIRGITVDSRSNFRMNGSLPINSSIAFPLEDKDRVEALKGASALYYGFSAPSGIVNFTMKRATAEPYAEADVFGNNYGALGGHVDVGGTADKLGYRINALYATLDPGIKNTLGDRSLLSGAFDYKITDRLTASLDAEHIYKEEPEPAQFRFTTAPKSTIANPYPTIALPPLLDPKTNFGSPWMKNRAEETNVLSKLYWRFSDSWSALAEYGISDLRRERRLTTLNPTNIRTGDGVLTIAEQSSHFNNSYMRAELAGAFYTGPLLQEVVFGASRSIKDSNTPKAFNALCPGATPTAPQVSCTQNFFNPRPIPETAMPLFNADTTRIAENGYYFFDRMKVTEWLQLLGGVRKSNYTESDFTTGNNTFLASPWSYSYGAVIKPVEWASVYATYIQGLESIAPAPTTAVNAFQQLPAAESMQREVGIKLEPTHGLLLQLAGFSIERGAAYVNGANVYVEDGQALYRGIELSITGEITPDLSIYASGMYLNAKQDSGAPTLIVGNTITPTTVGKLIEGTAKNTYSLAAQYNLSSLLTGLSTTVGAYYVGPQAINALNEAFTGGYTTYDFGLGYQHEVFDHNMTFRVNGQNITNKRYWASTGGLFLGESLPRVVKFSVSTVF
jgi:iron complex outermembrane recepter protein